MAKPKTHALSTGKSAGESFDAYIARMRREHERKAKAVWSALEKSSALIFTHGERVELVIVSGEPMPGRPPLRATTFMVDGPWGHENYATKQQIADELAKRGWDEVRAADEDEVIEWTTTPEFVHGSKVVAYIQAANALRYWAAQKGYDSPEYRRADDLLRTTDRMDPSDVEKATALVEAELKTVSPVENPAWVTRVLASAYEAVAGRVPPAWLPKLSDVRARGGVVSARMREYGCGAYGCVLPTLDPKIVLKLTTDSTEAEFAGELASTLVAPIVVQYHTVLRLATKHQGRTVYLLWRESAEAVGEIESELGREAADLISIQHAAAQDVLHLIQRGAPIERISAAASAWLDTCEQIADNDDVPELAPLGRGLVSVFAEQRIFFGDVHTGNLGRVTRRGGPRWVITDPGNVIVFGRGA